MIEVVKAMNKNGGGRDVFEFTHLVFRLKKENKRLQILLEKYNSIEHELTKFERNIGNGYGDEIIRLTKKTTYKRLLVSNSC
ncbi:hypothetical protein [Enterobacter cloacae]|uniref:hypothetical protein n=1 Tax=Enterobacter cloacae TaxID=550 RepID=UPI0011C76F56|nr:hypothetical protein [Enterobacter cloacae]